MFKILCSLFVFLIPFYDVPKSFKEGVSYSIIIGFVILLLLVLQFLATRNKAIFQYPKALILPFSLFMSMYILSYILNIYNANDKAVNHIVFYLITFVIFTLVTNSIIRMYGTQWFAKVISISVVVVSLIGFYEFSLFYTHGWYIYATFLNHGTGVGIFDGFPRLRSTFSEPSHYALFMICVLPILLYGKRYFSFALAIISLLLTFSSSMFFGVAVSLFIAGFTMLLKPKIIKKILPILIYLSPLLMLIGLTSTILSTFVGRIIGASASDPYRYIAFKTALNKVGDIFFIGNGPASYYDDPLMGWGVFNWYLQVMYESGVFTLIALLTIIVITVKKATISKIPMARFSLIAFAFQMVSMEHYFIPGFWILMAFTFAIIGEIKVTTEQEQVIQGSDIINLKISTVPSLANNAG